MIGSTLGRFRIAGKLGEGGMGVVWRAEDPALGRQVAIKVVSPERLDARRRERFLREARAASALNHPNIVTIYEIGAQDGVDFIAMELVEGRPLAGAIPRSGLDVATALSYAVQIADALARAHGRGIVHRDLKPSNLMVTPEGRIKILDFGLAKQLAFASSSDSTLADEATPPPPTAAGVLMGTPQYMSPEQARGQAVDTRSDVFAFGAVLHELLTGVSPFRRDSDGETISAVLRDAPPPVTGIRADLPAELGRIVGKALEKDPADRYQHADHLLADLRALERRTASGETPASAAASPPLASRRRWWPLAALAAAVAVGGLGWWLATRSPAAAPPLEFHLVSNFPGSHRSPSFSPDGRMIAFLDVAQSPPQVWVRPLAGGDAVAITSGETPAQRPRWSPRGDQILFSRSGQGIWSVAPLGGTPRRILEEGRNPSFSGDGRRIVYETRDGIWTADADGGSPRRLEGVPPSPFLYFVDSFPAFSPDGRQIAFFRPEVGPNGDYWVVSAAGDEARRLTFDVALGGAAAWTPDGASLIVPSARSGSHNLWRVPIAGGTPEPVTTGAGEDDEPEVSADGTRLVYANSRTSTAIVASTPGGAARDVLERRGEVFFPDPSPTGDRLAFFAQVENDHQLFVVGADGSAPRQVTHEPGFNIFPHWSGNGEWLYFYHHPDPSFRRVRAEGGRSEKVADWDLGSQAIVDPAGRRVAYTVRGSGGLRGATVATRVRDLASGTETVLAAKIEGLRWSRDGRELLGFTASPRQIVVCPPDGGACRTLGRGHTADWSADGSHVVYICKVSPLEDPRLLALDVCKVARQGGEPERVARLEPVLDVAKHLAVSARGEILWTQHRRGRDELWLAELPPPSAAR